MTSVPIIKGQGDWIFTKSESDIGNTPGENCFPQNVHQVNYLDSFPLQSSEMQLEISDDKAHGIESAERVQQLRRAHWIVVHVPFILVVWVILISMCLICIGHWRKGTTIMGIDAIFAGIVRWILPDSRAGLLMVTSKLKDIGIYFILGALIIYLSLTIASLH